MNDKVNTKTNKDVWDNIKTKGWWTVFFEWNSKLLRLVCWYDKQEKVYFIVWDDKSMSNKTEFIPYLIKYMKKLWFKSSDPKDDESNENFSFNSIDSDMLFKSEDKETYEKHVDYICQIAREDWNSEESNQRLKEQLLSYKKEGIFLPNYLSDIWIYNNFKATTLDLIVWFIKDKIEIEKDKSLFEKYSYRFANYCQELNKLWFWHIEIFQIAKKLDQNVHGWSYSIENLEIIINLPIFKKLLKKSLIWSWTKITKKNINPLCLTDTTVYLDYYEKYWLKESPFFWLLSKLSWIELRKALLFLSLFVKYNKENDYIRNDFYDRFMNSYYWKEEEERLIWMINRYIEPIYWFTLNFESEEEEEEDKCPECWSELEFVRNSPLVDATYWWKAMVCSNPDCWFFHSV